MKKAMILLLSVLVALNVFVSCSQEQNTANEPTRMVQFNDGSGMTKALNRAPEGLKTEELYWSYTAEKVDNSGFTTGQTSKQVVVGSQGLTEKVGPFSQGSWKFTLYGYTDSSRTKLAWTGSKTETLTVNNGVSSPANVSINVHRLRTPGVNGIIRVPADIKVQNSGKQEIGTKYNRDVKIYKGEELLIFNDSTHTGTDYTVESGLYKVVVSAVNADGSIEYASNEIAVNVYDNLVTIVGGILDERTLNTQFSTNEKGETVASSPQTKIEFKGAEGTKSFEVKVESTPAEDHSAADKPTSVSFPEGSFAEGATNASITVKPSNIENANANSEFVVEANEAVVGAIDIDVMVDGTKTSTFKGQKATVTTYIQPGLPTGAVAVKYHGTEADVNVELVSYDPADGKLVFTTNHFSEYYVVVKDIVVVNKDTNESFTSFVEAFNALDSEKKTIDTLVMLKDVTLPYDTYIVDKKENVTYCHLNGQGHSLTIEEPTSELKGTDSDFGLFEYYVGSIENLDFKTTGFKALCYIAHYVAFDEVDAYGIMEGSDTNVAPYVVFPAATVKFSNCDNHADIIDMMGGDHRGAAFVGGYYLTTEQAIGFFNCNNYGHIKFGGKAAMFIGNPTGLTTEPVIKNCKNYGVIEAFDTVGINTYDDDRDPSTVGINGEGGAIKLADNAIKSFVVNDDGTYKVEGTTDYEIRIHYNINYTNKETGKSAGNRNMTIVSSPSDLSKLPLEIALATQDHPHATVFEGKLYIDPYHYEFKESDTNYKFSNSIDFYVVNYNADHTDMLGCLYTTKTGVKLPVQK